VIIVDDDIVIMGSANINDRSMLGFKDSEIAIRVEDSTKIASKMGGQNVQVSKFASQMRRALYCEHMKLDEKDVIDPLSMDFQLKMRKIAKTNTLLYRTVFHCYPDDA
jgi:phospholipase D1/2